MCVHVIYISRSVNICSFVLLRTCHHDNQSKNINGSLTVLYLVVSIYFTRSFNVLICAISSILIHPFINSIHPLILLMVFDAVICFYNKMNIR